MYVWPLDVCTIDDFVGKILTCSRARDIGIINMGLWGPLKSLAFVTFKVFIFKWLFGSCLVLCDKDKKNK